MPVAGLFALILGGLYFRVFAPTEAAGIGAFGAALLAASQPAVDKWLNAMDSNGHDGQKGLDFYVAEVDAHAAR